MAADVHGDATVTAAPVKAGEVLAGRYVVEGVLASGGMGVVLSARHALLDERVAVKLLRPELSRDPDSVRRFVREAQAAARIRSEHAVRVLDVGLLDDSSPYIAMEFLQGHDLASELRARGPLAWTTAVDYVLQACEALAEAHSLGIIHRDLKPQNLFLTSAPGRPELVKVLDFGISKVPASGDTSITLETMGTPRYMSPEQMRSTRSADARSDLWSLGVVLFELLSGQAPFEAETAPMLCSLVLTEPPRDLRQFCPDLPSELLVAVMRCLEKDPARRFARIDALVEALAPFAPARARVSLDRISIMMSGPSSGPLPSVAAQALALQRSSDPTLGGPPRPHVPGGGALAPADSPSDPALAPTSTLPRLALVEPPSTSPAISAGRIALDRLSDAGPAPSEPAPALSEPAPLAASTRAPSPRLPWWPLAALPLALLAARALWLAPASSAGPPQASAEPPRPPAPEATAALSVPAVVVPQPQATSPSEAASAVASAPKATPAAAPQASASAPKTKPGKGPGERPAKASAGGDDLYGARR